jgi:sugar phosphate isomerase/epimerase
MDIGLLTAPFGQKPLEWVIAFARDNGFQALEVAAGPGSRHLDTQGFSAARAKEIKRLLSESGVRISSLAWYANLLDPDRAKRARLSRQMRDVIKAAAALDVEVVCTLAGMPMPGKDRMRTIEEDFPAVFRPLVRFAGQKRVKLVFENWFATNIMNLAHLQRVFEVVPDRNLGLNFDPSHLVWQGIDHLEAVDRFRDRIFHTHAKDVEIKQHVLRQVGNQSGGWWRYVIPGYGDINWGVYIARLRAVGYNGVLSIEHEDNAFGVEEGLIKGQRHLARYA